MDGSRIQSVYFPRSEWFKKDAVRWIVAHKFRPIKGEVTPTQYRFRIRSPYEFNHFITKRQMSRGRTVYFVIGFKVPRMAAYT